MGSIGAVMEPNSKKNAAPGKVTIGFYWIRIYTGNAYNINGVHCFICVTGLATSATLALGKTAG